MSLLWTDQLLESANVTGLCGVISKRNQQLDEDRSQKNPQRDVGDTENRMPHTMTSNSLPHLVIDILKSPMHPRDFTNQAEQSAFLKQATTSRNQHPWNDRSRTLLLVLQQLASKSNEGNFNNNIHRICEPTMSETATMPNCNSKLEDFELFEHSFRTNFKICLQLFEDLLNCLHLFMCGDALQLCKKISSESKTVWKKL